MIYILNFRYFELRPQHDRCIEKLKESEQTISTLKEEVVESERKHQKMYLQMYLKGQEAAKLEAADDALEEAVILIIILFIFSKSMNFV